MVNFQMEIPHDRKMDILVYDGLGKEIDIIANNKIFLRGSHQISGMHKTIPLAYTSLSFTMA